MKTVVNNVELPAGAFFLLYIIRSLQKRKGYCWASNRVLAEMTHFSKDYVSHLLTKLNRAGYIYLHITYHNKEVAYRQLYAFDKPEDSATKLEVVQKLEQDKTEEGTKARLIHNARYLGLSPLNILLALKVYGAELVENALIIVKNSKSCINPVKYFWACIHKKFTPNERAKKTYFGKAFKDAKRRIARLPSMEIVPPRKFDITESDFVADMTPEMKMRVIRHMPEAVKQKAKDHKLI